MLGDKRQSPTVVPVEKYQAALTDIENLVNKLGTTELELKHVRGKLTTYHEKIIDLEVSGLYKEQDVDQGQSKLTVMKYATESLKESNAALREQVQTLSQRLYDAKSSNLPAAYVVECFMNTVKSLDTHLTLISTDEKDNEYVTVSSALLSLCPNFQNFELNSTTLRDYVEQCMWGSDIAQLALQLNRIAFDYTDEALSLYFEADLAQSSMARKLDIDFTKLCTSFKKVLAPIRTFTDKENSALKSVVKTRNTKPLRKGISIKVQEAILVYHEEFFLQNIKK